MKEAKKEIFGYLKKHLEEHQKQCRKLMERDDLEEDDIDFLSGEIGDSENQIEQINYLFRLEEKKNGN